MKKITDKILKFKNIDKTHISLRDILKHFKTDSIILLILLVTLPTSIPGPPYAFGTSTIIGGTTTMILSTILFFDLSIEILPKKVLDFKIKKKYLEHKYFNLFIEKLKILENKFYKEKKSKFSLKKIYAITVFLQGFLMIIPLIFTNGVPSILVTMLSFLFLLNNQIILFFGMIVSNIVFFLYLLFFFYVYKFAKKYLKK